MYVLEGAKLIILPFKLLGICLNHHLLVPETAIASLGQHVGEIKSAAWHCSYLLLSIMPPNGYFPLQTYGFDFLTKGILASLHLHLYSDSLACENAHIFLHSF